MRKLLYIPIIHTETDLGSMASSIEASTAALLGEKRWARHKETIARFWQAVADYLSSIEATNLKIYQDGLAAGGDLGQRIVEVGAKRGSNNYGIILNLVRRGAEVRATEDAAMLQEEYDRLGKLTRPGLTAPTGLAHQEYETAQEHLTQERDKYIAANINATLREGEVGLLFLGAYHNVLPHLAPDILVEQVKEHTKVQAYFKALMQKRSEAEWERLAAYLAAPP